jgi:hypothetical protein
VEAVVMRGLAKSPADRYPDVRAFAAALRAGLGRTPITPSPTVPPAGDESRADGLIGRIKGLFRKG